MTAPFAIYEDPEEHDLISPTDMFEGDMSFASDISATNPDDALPSIEPEDEHQDEPLPYKSSYTSRKSSLRRSSGATGYSFISGLPSESSISSRPVPPPEDISDGRYSPRKDRPRFRNPESVRAMQMSSPPPMPTYEASRERLKGSYKLMTPSRTGRSETPVSKKSGSRRGSVRETHSPRPTATPQQAPLVLLHVTILPPQVPFSHDLMVRVMPEWLVENYKVLEEKLADIILMRRGLLIPHPRDEYDLLEERILESLELKTPRLLKCGHFVAPELDSESESDDDRYSAAGDSTGRGSRMSGGTLNQEHDWAAHSVDAGTCMDCHRELKKPGKGVGAGRRKWDIKIYAANGLMREAAWAACWNDMERCDVEISPWIPDEVRKTLERRVQEEQEAEKRKQLYAAELQRQIQQSTAKQQILEEEAAERKRAEDARLQKSFEDAAAALERSKEEKAAEKRKFEDTLEEKIKEAKESIRLEMEAQVKDRIVALESALQDRKQREPTPPPVTVQKRRVSRASSGQHHTGEIPLGVLLKNYILILLRDQRNFIIVLLSVVVVYLSLNMNQTSVQLPPQQTITSHVEDVIFEPVPTVSVTTTATTTATATSFSTFTVTEVITATSVVEVAQPVFSAEVPEPVAVDDVVEPASEVEETVLQTINEEEQVSPVVEADVMPAAAELKETVSLTLESASQVEFSLAGDIFQLSLPICAKVEN